MPGLGVSFGLGFTRKALSAGASLIALGSIYAGALGHSYEQGAASGGPLPTSNPQISTNAKSFMALWASYNPAIRFDVIRVPQYSTLAKATSWTTATPALLETVSQAATGAAGIVRSTSSNFVTIEKTNDKDFNTTAVAFSGGGSASSLATVVNANAGLYEQGLQGDTLTAFSGNIGIVNRLPKLQALTHAPNILYLNGPYNDLIAGVSAAATLTRARALFDATRAAFPSALIFMADCNPFQSGSGANTDPIRHAIADYLTAFWADVASWPGYDTTFKPLSLFMSMLQGSTGVLATDIANFYSGTNYGDPAKMVDPNHAGPGAYHDIIETADAWLASKIVAGDYWWALNGSNTNSITANPSATFSGTTGTKTNCTGTVPTGLTVNFTAGTLPDAPGGDTASTVVCSIEAGDGTAATAYTPVGSNNLVIDYTNNGAISDVIKISPNTVTGGVFAVGFTGWVQQRVKVTHDASGIAQNIMAQIALNTSQKTQALASDAAMLALGRGLPPVARTRYMLTPPVNFDGVNIVPNAIGKPLIQIEGITAAHATRRGTQRFRVCPPWFICQVTDPTV